MVQQTTLHRGLSFGEHTPEEVQGIMKDPHRFISENVNRRQTGIHWTPSVDSAFNFATDRDPDGWAHESGGYDDDDEPSGDPFGVVLSARVHPRHIVQRGTAEHDDYSMGSAILHEGSNEQETTVRDQGRVHVREAHFFHGSEHIGTVRGRWSGRA
jgi:hypothetical protein